MTLHQDCVPISELKRLADFHDEQHQVFIRCCSLCVDRKKWLTGIVETGEES